MATTLMRKFVCPPWEKGKVRGDKDMRDIGADAQGRANGESSGGKGSRDGSSKKETVVERTEQTLIPRENAKQWIVSRERIDSGDITTGKPASVKNSEKAPATDTFAGASDDINTEDFSQSFEADMIEVLNKYWRTNEEEFEA